MVNVDLTPTELAMVISRVDRFPAHKSSMEYALVDKLKAAVPSPTVQVELSAAQLDRIQAWHMMAENEGSMSTYGPEADELSRVLADAREKF